jgi:hypothetical protein
MQGVAYRCYVGSAGWEHPEWEGVFYPEELPSEWRLTYYNTAFPCVYLAYGEWGRRGPDELSRWVDDTGEHFRFVLEANPKGTTQADGERLAILASRVGLLVGDAAWRFPDGSAPAGELMWLPKQVDLKRLAAELASRVQSRFPGGPVYLISRDHDLATMNQAKTLLEIMGI